MSKFRLGNTKASKLTARLVMQMREDWASGDFTQAALSRKYQVSIGTVRNVIFGLTWQSLPAVTPDEQVMFEAEQSLNKLAIAEPLDIDPEVLARLNKDLATASPADEPIESTEDILNRRAARAALTKEDPIEPSSATEPPAPRDESGVDR